MYKYGRVLPAANWFARRLVPLVPQPAADLLVPVPLSRERRRERGFNQSELMARRLARLAGLRCYPAALIRRRETWSQAGLSREERERNVRGAFHVPDPHRINGRRILLLDDVLTTGATVAACAAALKKAGAATVSVITVARADLLAAAFGQAAPQAAACSEAAPQAAQNHAALRTRKLS